MHPCDALMLHPMRILQPEFLKPAPATQGLHKKRSKIPRSPEPQAARVLKAEIKLE